MITHFTIAGSITVLGMNTSDFTAAMFDLPDGSTTSTTTEAGDTLLLYENPWEGTESSGILIDQTNSTRMVGLGRQRPSTRGEDDDMLEGGSGDDALMGEGGDDTIDGRADNDTLYGGSGADKSCSKPATAPTPSTWPRSLASPALGPHHHWRRHHRGDRPLHPRRHDSGSKTLLVLHAQNFLAGIVDNSPYGV